jgi:hypothetical protein
VEGNGEEAWGKEGSEKECKGVEEGENRGATQVDTVATRDGEDSTGGLGHDVCGQRHEGPKQGLPRCGRGWADFC